MSCVHKKLKKAKLEIRLMTNERQALEARHNTVVQELQDWRSGKQGRVDHEKQEMASQITTLKKTVADMAIIEGRNANHTKLANRRADLEAQKVRVCQREIKLLKRELGRPESIEE